MSKRILISPNAFKHSISAVDAANTIKDSLKSLKLDLNYELSPIADGGDSTLDVLKFSFKESKFINCIVHDPLMRKIKSKWLLLNRNTAVIELARASGLSLLDPGELNPLCANTFGTGELILSALDAGCRKIIVALGGSATVDAGLGIMLALGVCIFDKDMKRIVPPEPLLKSICSLDLGSLDKRIKKTNFTVLCDVQAPLTGKDGVLKFALQKGASRQEWKVIEKSIKNFSDITRLITGERYNLSPMTGAAGGVAFSFKAFLNAELVDGFSYLAGLISLESKIRKAEVIITGEGKLDSQTLDGKGVYGIAKLAKKFKKSIVVLCGDYEKKIKWASYNMKPVIKIKPENMKINKAIKNVRELIRTSVRDKYKMFING